MHCRMLSSNPGLASEGDEMNFPLLRIAITEAFIYLVLYSFLGI